jgi:hypothetical protein
MMEGQECKTGPDQKWVLVREETLKGKEKEGNMVDVLYIVV